MKKILILLLIFSTIVELKSQSNSWVAVMSGDGDYEQYWCTTESFPDSEIQQYWDKEYRITSISYGAGKWALVMTKKGNYPQAWRGNKNFPEDEITEFWNKDFRITSLSYGAGTWAVVMSKVEDYPQVWRTNVVFPEKEIKEFWDKDHRITSLSYGTGKWALVMSKDGDYEQIWRTKTYFPDDEIKEFWDKDYRITSLSYGAGKWALVMSKAGDYSQTWRSNKNFPEEEINEFRAKNYNISILSYGKYIKKSAENKAPVIAITVPDMSRGYKIVEEEMLFVAGKATDIDGISKVTVNGKTANLKNNGSFSINISLQRGKNVITIVATDNKLKSSSKIFEVDHQPEELVDNYVTDEKRVALIFGNSNYTGSANLGNNPINDANDMASTLKSLGFEVIIKTDADMYDMKNAVKEFGRINNDATVALFYFAGHGMQIERVNYLLPVGVNIGNKNDVELECISVNTIQNIMESNNDDRLNIMILDACRNNPFRTWERGGAAGLSDMTPPSGTLIAFATSPGSTASNGDSRNGLYTGELIKQLKKGQRIEDVFINTRVEVEKKSGGQQSPWELARLRGIYYLKK